MNSLIKKRRTRFACFAIVGLTLATILAAAPEASAQYGYGGGFRGGREYRENFGGRGYGYGGGFNRGYGYGNGFYNRGYNGGGFGNGFYNRGYGGYGGGLNIGIGVPIVPQVYGPGYGYGGVGGYY